MVLLYEASNAIEAHMILDLLQQQRLTGRIDGEFLQGGVGELQAIGVVRVMINKDDYTEAKRIIDEWDTAQTEPEYENQYTVNLSPLSAGLLGFVLGALAMILYYSVLS